MNFGCSGRNLKEETNYDGLVGNGVKTGRSGQPEVDLQRNHETYIGKFCKTLGLIAKGDSIAAPSHEESGDWMINLGGSCPDSCCSSITITKNQAETGELMLVLTSILGHVKAFYPIFSSHPEWEPESTPFLKLGRAQSLLQLKI